MALAMVLLSGAGVLVRSLVKIVGADTDMRRDHLRRFARAASV
jgi:hypothetical protein